MPRPGGLGFILDVQAILLSQLKTRSVVPLIPATSAPSRIAVLNPVFELEGATYVMVTQAIGTVELRKLGRPVVSLGQHHDAVTRALDFPFIGY